MESLLMSLGKKQSDFGYMNSLVLSFKTMLSQCYYSTKIRNKLMNPLKLHHLLTF